MTNNSQHASTQPPPIPDTGALLLAAGGLAAAFGAASCCALPLLLGTLGLGSAWLATVAWFAAPHRILALIVAAVCLAGGGGVFFWRRGGACTPGTACGRPIITALLTLTLPAGGLLVVLGYLYG